MIVMDDLINYIQEHTVQGACVYDLCWDASGKSEDDQPTGHTANVEFFKVSLKNDPDAAVLKKLINDSTGIFCELNLFDGNEHSYINIGAWIGDQGLALILMGMGELLDMWNLLTPTSMGMPEELRQQMAGQGMVTIQFKGE